MTSDAPSRVLAALEVLLDPVLYGQRHGARIEAGVSALDHFVSTGLQQGLSPHPLFDPSWYVARHHLPAAENPFVHFVTVGEPAGLSPGPFFDTAWYRRNHPDVAAAGVNSLVHYVEYGRSEGRWPSPMFDSATPAGPLGAFTLQVGAADDPRWILALTPRPTTLTRLVSGQEATSFTHPETVRQVVVRTRPPPAGRSVSDVVVMGGAGGVLSADGEGVLCGPGVEHGWALAHVTHAVTPAVDTAIHLLGRGAPRDDVQLERWATGVRAAAQGLTSPCLLMDETLPTTVSARLLSAVDGDGAAFRVPARRLLAVKRLITLGPDTPV